MNNRYKTIILILATTAYFLECYMVSAVNISLPAIQREFGVNAVLLSWIGTAYLLATVVALLLVGRLADIYGRKKLFSLGLLGMVVTSLLIGLVNSVPTLIFLRCLQGAFGGMIVTTIIAIVTSIFPLQERGKVMGIMVASAYVGLTAGPFLGGLITNFMNWRAVFYITAIVGFVSLSLTLKYLEGEWVEAEGEKFDIIGSLIYAAGMVMLIYGATILPKGQGIILTIFGLLSLYIFYKHQQSSASPLLEVRIFKDNRILVFSNIASMINYAATSAVTFLLCLYLQYIKGLAPQTAGLVILIFPVTQVLFSTYCGKLSDRFEPGKIASMGMGVSALSLFIMIFFGQQTSIGVIVASLVLLGLGLALFAPANTNAIMSSVQKKSYGVASALVAIMRFLGQTWSMALSTLIISLYMGGSQLTPANYATFLISSRTSYIVFTILCLIGTYLSYIRNKPVLFNKNPECELT